MITLKGVNLPKPIQHFTDFEFPDYVMSEIKRQNYDTPTAIQGQGWPIALSGRDFVGIAQVPIILFSFLNCSSMRLLITF